MTSDDMETPLQPVGAIISAHSVADLVEFHWLAITHTQNIREDVEGASNRVEYLRGLALLLVQLFHEMQDRLAGRYRPIHWCHRLADAMQNGLLVFPGMTSAELSAPVRIGAYDIDADTYRQELVQLIAKCMNLVPGETPETLGPTGQRSMLKAMRQWSALATELDEDLAFLEQRLRDL